MILRLVDNERLRFDGPSGRYCLGEHALHCGTCIQVLLCGKWLHTRIEHGSNGWYLVGIQHVSLDGLEARFEP
jgi:hypothetical protein